MRGGSLDQALGEVFHVQGGVKINFIAEVYHSFGQAKEKRRSMDNFFCQGIGGLQHFLRLDNLADQAKSEGLLGGYSLVGEEDLLGLRFSDQAGEKIGGANIREGL